MILTDQKLYELCKKYGSQAKLWRQKFIGLLPEVNRRRLYEKMGCNSIFEFAAKLCGLSAEQVRLALNLEKRLEDKPVLKNLLVNGEVSINKLARVVSITTVENQQTIAGKIMILPKSALETWVRDAKFVQHATNNGNALQKPLFDDKSLPGQTTNLNFEISEDIKKELNELHTKGINVNDFLRKMLEHRRENIAREKEEISKEIHKKMSEKNKYISRNLTKKTQEANQATTKKDQNILLSRQKYIKPSRYIPVRIKKILYEEYGEKCSILTCKKPSQQIHHTQRFSLTKNHDAKYLAPLCAEHHVIAHSIDLKFHQVRQVAVNFSGYVPMSK